MDHQTLVTDYFSTSWKPKPLSAHKFSGLAILSKIKSTDKVIDIGCGANQFKPYITDLIGIDPANSNADLKLTLEDFSKINKEKFSVAICFGSINFGTEDNITNQISLITELLTINGKIFWRFNPGLYDHGNDDFKNVNLYAWTEDKAKFFANKFNFQIDELVYESPNRIYSEWTKK